MALKGNEVLYVQGISANGFLSPVTEQTTTQAIANLANTEDTSLSETSVTAATGTTLTAAALVSGQIARTGTSAAFTDTTDSAANIVAALPGFISGSTFLIRIKNATAYTQTLQAGSSVTLPATLIIGPFMAGNYFATIGGTSGSPTVTLTHMNTVPIATNIPVTAQSTASVSAATGTTITAAAIVNGGVTRSGPVGSFTDTTDTAGNIIAAQPGMVTKIGTSFLFVYANTTTQLATLTGGSGVTVSGASILPSETIGEYLVTYTAANTITMVCLGVTQILATQVALTGATTGQTIIQASTTASGTLTLPATTDTLTANAATQTLTGKTLSNNIGAAVGGIATGTFTQASNTTLATVTGMAALLVAGATYAFEGYLVGTNSVTGGLALTMAAVSGLTVTSFLANTFVFTGTTVTGANAVSSFGSLFSAADAFTYGTIRGSIVVNAGGIVQLQAAQAASNSTATTITNGSSLVFTRTA